MLKLVIHFVSDGLASVFVAVVAVLGLGFCFCFVFVLVCFLPFYVLFLLCLLVPV